MIWGYQLFQEPPHLSSLSLYQLPAKVCLQSVGVLEDLCTSVAWRLTHQQWVQKSANNYGSGSWDTYVFQAIQLSILGFTDFEPVHHTSSLVFQPCFMFIPDHSWPIPYTPQKTWLIVKCPQWNCQQDSTLQKTTVAAEDGPFIVDSPIKMRISHT